MDRGLRDALLGPWFLQNLAIVSAMVGDTEPALETLEEWVSLRPDDFWPDEPFWDPIREELRFVALAEARFPER